MLCVAERLAEDDAVWIDELDAERLALVDPLELTVAVMVVVVVAVVDTEAVVLGL